METPTVSVDPEHLGDIKKCVDLVVETFSKFGAKPEVYQVDEGNPLVHATFDLDQNLPTVTVYNHMDVQPPAQLDNEHQELMDKLSKLDGAEFDVKALHPFG